MIEGQVAEAPVPSRGRGPPAVGALGGWLPLATDSACAPSGLPAGSPVPGLPLLFHFFLLFSLFL